MARACLPFFVMIDLIKSDEFDFWLPLSIDADLEKSFGKSSSVTAAAAKVVARSAGPHTRGIFGIASTEDRDLQNEIVYKRGIDSAYFLKYGYYNNDHKPGFGNKVGEPTEVQVRLDGLYTAGYLWEPGVHKIADDIWELAQALLASGSTRKLGFSIQGKVVRRAGRKVLKCWLQDVAITPAPINTNTWMDIAKSLSAVPEDMWCEGEHGLIVPEMMGKSLACSCEKPCSKACGKKAIQDKDIDLIKEGEKEEKALSTGTAGGALVPESLDRDEKDQSWANKSVDGDDLGFAECVFVLRKHRGYSEDEASIITKAIFELNDLQVTV